MKYRIYKNGLGQFFLQYKKVESDIEQDSDFDLIYDVLTGKLYFDSLKEAKDFLDTHKVKKVTEARAALVKVVWEEDYIEKASLDIDDKTEDII